MAKKITKKKSAPKKQAKNMSRKKINWKYPNREINILRIELLFVSIITFLVFLFLFFQLEGRLFPTILLTFIFVLIYFLIQQIVLKVHKIEEEYELDGSFLKIKRKVNNVIKKENKIHKKKIEKHKLDHRFLGAYVVSGGKRFPLYFNTAQEVKNFGKWVKKK
jgi:hypothetical protein